MFTNLVERGGGSGELEIERITGGSGLEDNIARAILLSRGQRTRGDWLRPLRWSRERGEVDESFAIWDHVTEDNEQGALAGARTRYWEKPDHFVAYVWRQVEEMVQTKDFNCKLWQQRYHQLQAINIGAPEERRDWYHAITNEAILVMQELWVQKMAPEAYHVGKEWLGRRVAIAPTKWRNPVAMTEVLMSWLSRENWIAKDVKEGHAEIMGSIKSPSSIVKEALLRQEPSWERLIIEAQQLGTQQDIFENKMDQAWEMVRLMGVVMDRGSEQQKQYWRELIEKEAGQMEHILRCRIYYSDPEIYNMAITDGLDKVGQYPAEIRRSYAKQIGMKRFMAVDTPEGYARLPVPARDSGERASGMSINQTEVTPAYMSAFWFCVFGQASQERGQPVVPMALNYFMYPVEVPAGGEIARLSELELGDQVVGLSVEMEMVWWKEVNNMHRWVWDKRGSGLGETDPTHPTNWRRRSSQVAEMMRVEVPVVDWSQVMQQLERVPRA